MKSKKKKSSPIITGAIVSLLLIVAIIGSIIYKYDVANRDLVNENDTLIGQNDEEAPNIEETDKQQVKPNEKEIPKEDNTDSLDIPAANGSETTNQANKPKKK